MTTNINILTDNVVNQIAAGEVIENPASVIKELVDNAIDAQATEIKIEIKNGGQQLIKVSDNGIGMKKDHLLLAIERHATSKLKTIDDLYSLNTMGFRGEALPSIASISKTTITSTEKNDQNCSGNTIYIEGGHIKQCKPYSRSHGTSVEVRSLFYNIPVRKKFLKSPSRETSDIHRYIIALSLGNPYVKFSFVNNHKTIFSLKNIDGINFKEALSNRIQNLLNKEFYENSNYFEYSEGTLSIKGFLGSPSQSRTNRLGQHIFINRRPISSQFISYAVLSGYGTRLTPGRFPSFVVHLTIPPDIIDINVHPQKKEVRFQQEITLRNFIVRAINQNLSQQHQETRYLQDSNDEAITPQFTKQFSWNDLKIECEKDTKNINDESNPVDFIINPIEDGIAIPEIVGIIDRYIIVYSYQICNNTGLTFIDSQEAQRTILFNKLFNQYRNIETVGVENLLLPINFELSSTEANILNKHLTDINKLGLSIRQFGGNSFIVDAIPQHLKYHDIKNTLQDIIENLKSPSEAFEEHGKRISLAIAKSSPVKSLTADTANSILKELFKYKDIEYSPFGKKIFSTLPLQEIRNTLN